MKGYSTIKVNFKGGIISPGDLLAILKEASCVNVQSVSFGLRQQLIIDVKNKFAETLEKAIMALGIFCEVNKNDYPNIASSYPAEEVFINNTWLSEGVYKDVLDELDYHPKLKINLCDSNQSFTPLQTGNINWVASPQSTHFWHLFIRLPKSNSIFEWSELVYTNDLARFSKEIERIILNSGNIQVSNLYEIASQSNISIRHANEKLQLPDFNLPYYEGFNRYGNNYWLGVYQRSEMFSVAFLVDVCKMCLDTKLGQLCSTPWKTIIIKGIAEKDRKFWSLLLDKHSINMRHAANELNFQLQDSDPSARRLKNFLVRELNVFDTRTFGICIGIKTKSKSEIFSTILIRRKPLLKIFGVELFHLYDILCAKDFNPNERTGNVFVSNITRFYLAEELRKSIEWYYKRKEDTAPEELVKESFNEKEKKVASSYVYQCLQCFSVYDDQYGDPINGVEIGTSFQQLPHDYSCPVCDGSKDKFNKVDKENLHAVAL